MIDKSIIELYITNMSGVSYLQHFGIYWKTPYILGYKDKEFDVRNAKHDGAFITWDQIFEKFIDEEMYLKMQKQLISHI